MMKYQIHFAPLQGYTDYVYREVHAKVFGGVDVYYTPFVRCDKEEFRKKDIKDILPEHNRHMLSVPQLIAATPEEFRRIASLFRAYGYRKADINLGCPFPKQVRLHRGAGILPYPEEISSLLASLSEFPEIAFSVKLRIGWNTNEQIRSVLPLLNNYPLTHITIHPRLGIRQYKGEIDRMAFRYVYDNCLHPLIYNGDLRTEKDVEELLVQFPRLKGVMLGRGLLASPWLAFEITNQKKWTEKEKREKLQLFHDLLVEDYRLLLEGGEAQVLSKLKTIWDYLLPDAEKKFRKKVLKSVTLPAYLMAVKDLFSSAAGEYRETFPE